MPWLVTPGQFARRAELYQQFASLTAAGVPLLQAIEQLRRHPPHASFREPLRRLLAELDAGTTFAEAVQRAGSWTSAFDVALLDMEMSGMDGAALVASSVEQLLSSSVASASAQARTT